MNLKKNYNLQVFSVKQGLSRNSRYGIPETMARSLKRKILSLLPVMCQPEKYV